MLIIILLYRPFVTVPTNQDKKTCLESRLPQIPYCCSEHLSEVLPLLSDYCVLLILKKCSYLETTFHACHTIEGNSMLALYAVFKSQMSTHPQ